jgi:Mor family transcriptional regulator
MAKKTKEQLEKENIELIALNNTWTEKFNKLECENNALKQQIKDGQLVFYYKVKNERGAGRKKIVTDEIKIQICKLFESCWTMDQLAKKFKLSKGTIFNVIHNFEYF